VCAAKWNSIPRYYHIEWWQDGRKRPITLLPPPRPAIPAHVPVQILAQTIRLRPFCSRTSVRESPVSWPSTPPLALPRISQFTKQQGQPNIFFSVTPGALGASSAKRANNSAKDFSHIGFCSLAIDMFLRCKGVPLSSRNRWPALSAAGLCGLNFRARGVAMAKTASLDIVRVPAGRVGRSIG
jgi:hypothetical protein